VSISEEGKEGFVLSVEIELAPDSMIKDYKLSFETLRTSQLQD